MSPTTAQGTSRYFPQTNHSVEGRFLDVWSQNGDFAANVYINGFPLTDKRPEVNIEDGKVYPTQWFERARFEEHVGNEPPFDVLLGRLGAFAAEGRQDTPFQRVPKPNSGTWFSETGHTVKGTIETYFNRYGGVKQFGLPLSEEFTEQSRDIPSKSYTVQYFERQRMELHPENKGTIYEVLLGRLGAEQEDQIPEMPASVVRGTNPVDVLRIGRNQEPASMMPYVDVISVGHRMRGLVFNGLTARDVDEKVVPDLASYVPTLENGGAYYVGTGDDKRLVVKFKLKHGIKWYDGEEVTSDDVLFTYKLNLEPDFPAPARQDWQYFASVLKVDRYTVIFNYLTWKEAQALITRDKATYGFLQAFVDKKIPVTNQLYNEIGIILPDHFLSKIKPADIVASDYARRPWGTGPYYVTKWETGQEMTLAVNPNYNVTPNKPVIKQIYSPLFTDPKQLALAIDLGNLDTMTSEAATLDVIPTLKEIAAKGRVRLISKAGYSYEHLDFNVQKEPFNDVRMRKAVRFAIDFNAINQVVFSGGVSLMNSWLPPQHWASIENPENIRLFPDLANQLVKYKFDPAQANGLLDQAGWSARDADGFRMKGGRRLTINFLTGTFPYRQKLGLILQQQLKDVGIDLTLDFRPPTQILTPGCEGPLLSGAYGDYGVAWAGWSFTSDEPGTNLFDTTSIPSPENGCTGLNWLYWSNAENDKLLREQSTFVGRPRDRVQLWLQQQILFSKELPQIPVFTRGTNVLVDARMQNFDIRQNGLMVHPELWYLPKQ